jgi:MFS transporter, MHS family, proline/betaine transporter
VLGYSLIGLALGTLVPSTFLAELFPTRLRYSGLSLTYGLGSALFGGTAPALAASWPGAPARPSRPPGTPPP